MQEQYNGFFSISKVTSEKPPTKLASHPISMQLSIILPVYNEAGIVQDVITSWLIILKKLKISFEIRIYNDGSSDTSLEKINSIAENQSQIIVIDKKNSGHGPTLLQGYRESKGDWIFQCDSDNEISPKFFPEMWIRRFEYNFIVGCRINRKQGLSRKMISMTAFWFCRLLYGQCIKDVNIPYRLMRNDIFQECFTQLSARTFAPNVLLSSWAAIKKINFYEIPVRYEHRKTGAVSIKKWKLFRGAMISLCQTIAFRLRVRH